MPIGYTVDTEAGIVRTRGHGRVTAGELLAYLRDLLSDGAVPQPIRDLHDLSAVEAFEVGAADVRALLEFSEALPAKLRDGRVAVIAPHDEIYGLSRMFELLSENAPSLEPLRKHGAGPKVAVFREREPAVTWLLTENRETAA